MLVIYVGTTKQVHICGNFLFNLTYHSTLMTSLRDSSFCIRSNCMTHSFTTTTLSSLLKIRCNFTQISFSLHNIWITNLVRTYGSLCLQFLSFQITIIEFLHSHHQISISFFASRNEDDVSNAQQESLLHIELNEPYRTNRSMSLSISFTVVDLVCIFANFVHLFKIHE